MSLRKGRTWNQGARQGPQNRGRARRSLAWQDVRNAGGQTWTLRRSKRHKAGWTRQEPMMTAQWSGSSRAEHGRESPRGSLNKDLTPRKYPVTWWGQVLGNLPLDTQNDGVPSQPFQPKLWEMTRSPALTSLMESRFWITGHESVYGETVKIFICSIIKDAKLK